MLIFPHITRSKTEHKLMFSLEILTWNQSHSVPTSLFLAPWSATRRWWLWCCSATSINYVSRLPKTQSADVQQSSGSPAAGQKTCRWSKFIGLVTKWLTIALYHCRLFKVCGAKSTKTRHFIHYWVLIPTAHSSYSVSHENIFCEWM